MKRSTLIAVIILLVFNIYSQETVTTKDGRKIILYDDHTWSEVQVRDARPVSDIVMEYKFKLRQGVKASSSEVQAACEMLYEGWAYTMPRPKSSQAAWGNSDKRTTWWNGYWHNSKTNAYSSITPYKGDSGAYIGDGQNRSNNWRNGGSPGMPDIYMILLSDSGGPY